MSEAKAPTPPAWAEEMGEILRAGATSQFVLHGSVFDLVGAEGKGGAPDWVSLPSFLVRQVLGDFDVVLQYDRSKGIRARKATNISSAS